MHHFHSIDHQHHCRVPIRARTQYPSKREGCILCISQLGRKHYGDWSRVMRSLHIIDSLKLTRYLALLSLVVCFSFKNIFGIYDYYNIEAYIKELLLPHVKKEKKKITKKNMLRPADIYSVNQRCYLSPFPFVISINVLIPKNTKDLFSLHGLNEW